MKQIILLLSSLSLSCVVNGQSKVKLEITNYAINGDEITLEAPLVIDATFKNKSEVYAIGKSGDEEVGVQFTLVKEGVGKEKYWVFQTEYMHKNKGRWINMCNTPRHKMKGPYHLKSYFECKYDERGNKFAVAYEVTATYP